MKTKVKLYSKKDKNKSILKSILEGRGIFDIEEYLNPEKNKLSSPYFFSDMEKAVDIIKNAIKNNDKILIWGDFDADGVTSTAILYKTFKALNANFDYFMPDRLNLGHGLNTGELLKRISKDKVKLIITVDCGIANLKEINLIKSMGVKIIVTDHHEALNTLPAANCIINPYAPNSIKEDLPVKDIEYISHLAGAGVAMKLSYALLDETYKVVRDEILVLASIGTIADVVPLIGENRVIAAKGLVEINNKKLKGIRRLFQELEINRELKSDDVAFLLAPRINSAGRLDSPFESIKLLIDESDMAINIAIEKLNNLNKIRQNLCDKTYKEALEILKNPDNCIVLYNENWHIGIIGIVASKLVEKFNMPVFLITKDDNDIYRCSIRGTKAYDISNILSAMQDCFTGFGGHSLAGGFSADSSKISIEELTKRITDTVNLLKDNTKDENSVYADLELNGEDITFELIDDIDKMEPFGADNLKPLFLFKNAKVLSHKQIGKDLSHLSFTVDKDGHIFECLFWKRPVFGFEKGEFIDFLFRLEKDTFNNEDRIKLIVECILNDKIQNNALAPLKFFDHREKTGILAKVDDYINKKNGEVKTFIQSVDTKKLLSKYQNILLNVIQDYKKQNSIMFFDYPSSIDEFKRIVNQIKPDNIHIMNSNYSKNPDEYMKLVCGMLKYAANNKNGEIDISLIAKNAGLDDVCIQIALELLEKINSIEILDIDKIALIKMPSIEVIHNDSMFEIFKDEVNRVINFKDYFKIAPITSLEEILNN